MKIKKNPFQFRFKGNIVEVWVGPPGDAESDFVLAVDVSLLDQLLATLTSVKGRR